MSSLMSTLAQASPPADTGDGSAVIGFLIIVGLLWAIYSSCNRKRKFRVRGEIDEV